MTDEFRFPDAMMLATTGNTTNRYFTPESMRNSYLFGFYPSSYLMLSKSSESSMEKHLVDLQALLAVEDEDFPPPTAWSVNQAKGAMMQLPYVTNEKYRVAASIDGGVVLSFNRQNRFAEIEFCNSKETQVLLTRPSVDPIIYFVGGEHCLLDALRNVDAFLRGSDDGVNAH